MAGHIEITRVGPLALLEDLGRPGYASVGVGTSGAADRTSHALANRIVGNGRGDATIEALFGGLEFVTDCDLLVAVAGAPAPVTVNGVQADNHSPLYLVPGDRLALGVPPTGLRSYVAVAGGFAEEPVLGSLSYDSMARLGPEPLASGRVLSVGDHPHDPPTLGHVPVRLPTLDPIEAAVVPGPRDAWMRDGLEPLVLGEWTVSPNSDRVGVRLEGVALERAEDYVTRELPSEGVVRGSIQLPSGGLPVIFLSDHPVTGGYPVIGVLTEVDADHVAQARPGQTITFHISKDRRHG